jgi:hypothetical protein
MDYPWGRSLGRKPGYTCSRAALFLLLWGVHYRLELFDLLFSDRGIVTGAIMPTFTEMPALSVT